MIRPFGLTDVWLVQRLQRVGVPMAIEHALTHPRDPLWTALTAPWPWAGTGVATFVLDEQADDARLMGFVQLMERAARPEADLLHLAPALSPIIGAEHDAGVCDPAGAAIWGRLLNHSSQAAAGHGLHRIFVSIPDGGPEQQCLKDAGFSLYAREAVYRLALASDGSPQAGFRPQGPGDNWSLQRLYLHSTPRLVQQAEGGVSGEVGTPLFSWWEPNDWRGIVWEPAGEVRGAVQIHIGRTGHWMRLLGVNALTGRELRALITQGLRLVSTEQARLRRRSLPVYVTVRDYEVGLAGALVGFGFAPYLDRARFVRHTMARVREATPVVLPSLEVRQEAAAHSRSR